MFESLLKWHFLSLQHDRLSAKIVVDPVARRGVLDGQIIVNDLELALRIAKNGDIIFIEEGTYSGRTIRQQSGNMKLVTEFNKSLTLVGYVSSFPDFGNTWKYSLVS